MVLGFYVDLCVLCSLPDRDHFQLGSLSHLLNTKAGGYQELPDWPQDAPDPSVRNVEVKESVRAVGTVTYRDPEMRAAGGVGGGGGRMEGLSSQLTPTSTPRMWRGARGSCSLQTGQCLRAGVGAG